MCLGAHVIKFLLNRTEKLYERLGLRSKMIELDNGSSVHCWIPDNQDKPCVMLIHGFGANGCVGWENQVVEFTKRFSVYVPDLVFFGKSTTSNSQRSEFFQAECLIDLLRKVQVKKVMVVGTSYGGFVAFRMAHMAPELVQRVVIASSGVCMVPTTNDEILKDFNATHIREVLLPTSVAVQKKSLNRCLYKPLMLPSFIVQGYMDVFGENRDEKVELLDGLVIGTADALPLPGLHQEVLIVWGAKDAIFNLKLGYQLQSHLGVKSKLVVIPEAGHIPQVEKVREFNRVVCDFLGEYSSRSNFMY